MQSYYKNLNPREQKIVLIAGFLLLLFIPYQFIYSPFQNKLTMLQVKSSSALKDITKLKNGVAEAKMLRGNPTGTQRKGQSLLSLVEQTAKRSKLRKELKKVQPDGSSNIRVWFEDVSFDKLMRWLDILVVKKGLTIIDLSIDKQSNNGIVNARIKMSSE